MEIQQDHTKSNQPSLGHESNGVHVCHKCGWPFPKPHPSARNRRSHKKVCGTIEGYKLVDSSAGPNTPPYLSVSDDDHFDEDSKTPSPKMKKSNYEIGGSGMRVNSGISEDEVFSDAVTEFTDGGSGHGSEEAAEKLKETVTVQEPTTTKDAATTIQSSMEDATTDDKNLMQNIQVQEHHQTGNKHEFKDHVPDPTACIVEKSTYHGTEKSVNDPDSNQVDSEHPLRSLETKVDVSQENKEKIAGERKTETVTRRNCETGSDGDSLKVVASPKDNVAESTDGMSNVGNEGIALDPTPTGVSQSKKEHTEGLFLPSPIGNLAAEDKSNLEIDADAVISQPKLDDAERTDSDSPSNLVEYHVEKRQPDENMHLLTLPANIPTVDNAEIMSKGFKDHDGGKFPKFTVGDSLDIIDEGKSSSHKDDPFSFHAKPLDEVSDVTPMDTHFVKDDLEMKSGSSKPTILPPEEKSDVAQSSFLEKRSDNLGNLSDSVAIQAEKSSFQDHGSNLSENDSVGHSTSVQSELKLVAEDTQVMKMENQVRDNTGDEDAKTGREEAELDKKGTLDDDGTENVVAAPRTVGILYDTENNERTTVDAGDDKQNRVGKTELSKVSGIETGEVDSSMEVGEKNLSVKSESKAESADLQAFEFQPNTEDKIDVSEAKLANSGHTDADTGLDFVECWKEETAAEGHVISGSEAKEANPSSKPAMENLSTNMDRTGVSAIINVERGTEGDLSERTECKSIGETLTTPDCLKKSESKDVEKVQASECAEMSMVAESDDRRTTELKQSTPDEHTTKVHQISLSEASSFTVKDNHTGSSIDVVAGDKPETHHSEGTLKAQQIGTSVSEFSVDSVSRTDSLEGHWGSVSVLSFTSDIPASVDAESLPSTGHQASPGVEKDNVKNSKAPAPGQSSEESDMFEPPSFMTLVEPKAAKSDPKADSSQIPMAYNIQQSKAASLQAGWFPSLTHVANESQGRKQNEEIIAKVTNWNAGKQRSPLKNLLGDAKVEGKPRPPNAAESPKSRVQIDEPKANDNSASTTTISSILAPEAPSNEAKTDAGKEWNSPARYPTNIKREKRKVKGRPYWAQFVCCSSGN